MRGRIALTFVLSASVLFAVVIDRIAIVVGNAIIKDSDIDRNVRETQFLNNQQFNLSEPERKAAANRLIDQILIRREVRLGDYPRATAEEAETELSALVKQRFHTQSALQRALRAYGLNELQLREDFQWQLTVLRFIDARFKPAVFISDQAIQDYYKEHLVQLRRQYPNAYSLQDVSTYIRNALTEEQVNKLFFSWLDGQRKEANTQYLEESLK